MSWEIRHGKEGFAIFDMDGPYRYWLERCWNKSLPSLDFIMLNPSIGDEHRLESTTAGALSRAMKWGYGSLRVVNLFAHISTDPKKLKEVVDPVGQHNDLFIEKLVEDSKQVICAWGKAGTLLGRDKQVLKMIKEPYCLGMNLDGTPKHPLHMAHSEKPRRYENGS